MAALNDDLLELAAQLTSAYEPKEASLRRSVSTAYYALFHLLIYEATLNWSISEQRSALGRAFDHGTMKQACAQRKSEAKRRGPTPATPGTEESLKFVADTFVRLQDHRHAADYDTSRAWSETDAAELVVSVIEAFGQWAAIRETPEAQDFLLSLFVKKR